MKKRIGAVVIVLVCCVAGGWPARVARASACGYFYADSGDNTIILGEKTGYFYYQGQLYYYGLGDLAICWTDADEVTQFELFSDCDRSSSSSDFVYVSALAGNDKVGPNTTGHICKVGYLSTYMLPFDDAGFDFYLYADMGTGSDWAYGTANGDVLMSNSIGVYPDSFPADSAEDHLCGYDGDDDLYGDHDDTNTYEELLSGGNGTDYCNGGYDGDVYDWIDSGTCETHLYGYHINNRLGCGTSAPSIWWF